MFTSLPSSGNGSPVAGSTSKSGSAPVATSLTLVSHTEERGEAFGMGPTCTITSERRIADAPALNEVDTVDGAVAADGGEGAVCTLAGIGSVSASLIAMSDEPRARALAGAYALVACPTETSESAGTITTVVASLADDAWGGCTAGSGAACGRFSTSGPSWCSSTACS